MAQSLFDAIVGVSSIDNNAYLAVQSLLDPQTLGEHQGQAPNQLQTQLPPDDDEDVFQCGKCKKQFNSLQIFVQHKQNCPGPVTHLQQTYRQSAAVSPTSTLNQLTTNIVLPDDIMTLTLDPNSSLHVQGQQNNPFLSSANLAPRQQLPYSSSQNILPSFTNTLNGQYQLHPVTVMSQNSNAPVSLHHGHMSSQSTNMVVLVDQGVDSLPSHEEQPVQETLQIAEGQVSGPEQSEKLQRRTKTRKKTEGRQILTCMWCSKTFSKRFDLVQHERAHTGEKPYQCVVCGRAFSQKSNVKKHMQTHKVWPSGPNSTLPPQPPPQLIVVQEKEPRAPQQEQNSTDDNLITVKWNFLVDSSYKCPYCPELTKFDSYYKLRSHLVIHKTERVYKCIKKDCPETFLDLDVFLQHTRLHEDEMTYRCHVCNKQFTTMDEFGRHQLTHNGLVDHEAGRKNKTPCPFKCTQCNSVYASPEALEHHIATSTHKYPCPHCVKVFPCERYLRRHLAFHNSESDHVCSICSKKFKTEYYLKLHMLIHTGEKPYSCEICKKAFNRKDKVKRHMLIHETVKRFVCPFKELMGCERAFNRPDKLREHITKHTSLNPISKAAGNSAANVVLLTKSNKASNDMDAMLCRYCQNDRFETAEQLHEHEDLCIQVPRIVCTKCNLTFNTKESLSIHDCKPNTQTVVVSNISAIRLPIMQKRGRKKRKIGKPNRIQLSPPPAYRSRRNRMRPRRFRDDDDDDGQTTSQVNVTQKDSSDLFSDKVTQELGLDIDPHDDVNTQFVVVDIGAAMGSSGLDLGDSVPSD